MLRNLRKSVSGGCRTIVCPSALLSRDASASLSSDVVPGDRSSPPRSKEFYAQMGVERKYFYVLNTRGQIFLEETTPRNIATSLKDPKFVNFMHTNLRPNDTKGGLDNYPFVTYCGKETNFVCPQDTLSAFVFRDLVTAKGHPVTDISRAFESPGRDEVKLCYGHDIWHPFDPAELIFIPDSGRLYHRILSHKYLTGKLGLLHPFLCQQISQYIQYKDDTNRYTLMWGENVTIELPSVL